MQRRGFLKAVGALVHGVIGVLLAVPAVRFLLSPLSNARKRFPGMIRVIPFEVLAKDQPFRALDSGECEPATHHYRIGDADLQHLALQRVHVEPGV